MRYLLFAACILALCYGLFRPESPPDLFEQSDKVMHLLAFAAVAFSSRLAFQRVAGWPFWGLLLLLAPLLEWLQHRLQPSRQFSQEDMLANLLGVLLGLIAWLVWQALRKRFMTPQQV